MVDDIIGGGCHRKCRISDIGRWYSAAVGLCFIYFSLKANNMLKKKVNFYRYSVIFYWTKFRCLLLEQFYFLKLFDDNTYDAFQLFILPYITTELLTLQHPWSEICRFSDTIMGLVFFLYFYFVIYCLISLLSYLVGLTTFTFRY